MRVLIFSKALSETFRILTRIQRDIVINVHTSACKSTHYSCQILLQPERFIDRYSRSSYIPNFMKIRPVEAGLFHAYRDA
jgi:hypothetical protein